MKRRRMWLTDHVYYVKCDHLSKMLEMQDAFGSAEPEPWDSLSQQLCITEHNVAQTAKNADGCVSVQESLLMEFLIPALTLALARGILRPSRTSFISLSVASAVLQLVPMSGPRGENVQSHPVSSTV